MRRLLWGAASIARKQWPIGVFLCRTKQHYKGVRWKILDARSGRPFSACLPRRLPNAVPSAGYGPHKHVISLRGWFAIECDVYAKPGRRAYRPGGVCRGRIARTRHRVGLSLQ